MKSLYAFGSGGSSFPGTPVAGVYLATDATIDAVSAPVVSILYSVVVNIDNGSTWYANGTGMTLLVATPPDFASFPLPTTSGGVVYSVPFLSIGADQTTQIVSYFDGTDWISTGQP